MAAFKAAIKDFNFVMLLISFSFVDGSFISLGSILSAIFTPVGFDTVQINILGIACTIFGISSSMITGAYVQRTHRYKLFLCLSAWGTAITCCTALITFPTGNFPLVLVNVCVIGVFIVPVIPISMNLSQEITFPME